MRAAGRALTVGELVDDLSTADPLATVRAMNVPVTDCVASIGVYELNPGYESWSGDQQDRVIALLRRIAKANVGSGSAKAVLVDWAYEIADVAAAVLEDLEG